MRVTVTMNNAALTKLSNAQKIALSLTAQEILNRTRNEQLMPFDTGSLQNEGTYISDSKLSSTGSVTIITDVPYAQRLYFHPEYNFQKGKNANAGGEWWEDWISGQRKKEAIKIYARIYSRIGGL